MPAITTGREAKDVIQGRTYCGMLEKEVRIMGEGGCNQCLHCQHYGKLPEEIRALVDYQTDRAKVQRMYSMSDDVDCRDESEGKETDMKEILPEITAEKLFMCNYDPERDLTLARYSRGELLTDAEAYKLVVESAFTPKKQELPRKEIRKQERAVEDPEPESRKQANQEFGRYHSRN